MQLSRYAYFSPEFADTASGYACEIMFSTRTNQRYLLDARTATLLRQGLLSEISADLRQSLISDKLIVSDNTDELAEVIEENFIIDDSNRSYRLTIMPTANCQLGCVYCAQSHSNTSPTRAIEGKILALAESQVALRDYTTFNTSWFGGEPLINLALIRRLTPQLRALAHGRGMRYQANVITNGLMLSASVARELFSDLNVVQVQVTLDGLERTHDLRRKRKGGQGSFGQIVGNLIEIARSDISRINVHIRCNVDQENCHEIEPLLDYLVDLGVSPIIKRFQVVQVFDWDNDAAKNFIASQEFADLQIRVAKKLMSHGMRHDPIPTRRTGMCNVFYSRDSLFVDPAGKIATCYEDPLVSSRSENIRSDDRNGVSRRTQFPTDVLSLMSEEVDGCPSCVMLPICGGVCEPHWAKQSRECPGFKINLGEQLILDYLAKGREGHVEL